MNERELLSQEEIDALLGNSLDIAETDIIDPRGKDALGEIGNISMGASATALYTILGKRVKITTPRVTITTIKEIKKEHPLPFVVVEVQYTRGIEGTNILIIKEKDAKIIADLMMGGEGKDIENVELDEIRFSAVSEAMNQMMGAAATSMATVFKKDISISPPISKLVNFAEETEGLVSFESNEGIVLVSFEMEVENLIQSEIMQLIPIPFAKEMVRSLINIEPIKGCANVTENDMKTEIQYQIQKVGKDSLEEVTAIPIKPIRFDTLNDKGLKGNSNLNMIMDIPLEVSVELGRTTKLIKDVLRLAPGSVIELDKLAGEPVDILVNGKFLAKGEVVVIDENFGVRITEIITPIERVNNLQ